MFTIMFTRDFCVLIMCMLTKNITYAEINKTDSPDLNLTTNNNNENQTKLFYTKYVIPALQSLYDKESGFINLDKLPKLPHFNDTDRTIIIQERENILNGSEEKLVIFAVFTFMILLICWFFYILGLLIAIVYLVVTRCNSSNTSA
ncbi:hypothetical protein WDU94_008359 [Cyamophila willieti]